jgi:hypothetical protein
VASYAGGATRYIPQGTWRCLGHSVGVISCCGGFYIYMPTLWLRIT